MISKNAQRPISEQDQDQFYRRPNTYIQGHLSASGKGQVVKDKKRHRGKRSNKVIT